MEKFDLFLKVYTVIVLIVWVVSIAILSYVSRRKSLYDYYKNLQDNALRHDHENRPIIFVRKIWAYGRPVWTNPDLLAKKALFRDRNSVLSSWERERYGVGRKPTVNKGINSYRLVRCWYKCGLLR